MKATLFEYRHRYILHAIIFTIGFSAPWNYWLHLDPSGANAHTWGMLAINLTQLGIVNIATAFNLLLSVAIACAFLGAFLRTWGSSYLGAGIVQSPTMHTAESSPAPGIIEAGPYRHLRNPLYLGTILHTLALALLMPRSGAIFTLIAIPVAQFRLILAEEPFLLAKLGTPYAAYCKLVPRIVPALRPRIPSQPLIPRWPQALLGEIYMWGVALSFAFAGWRYNAWLLIQCVVVSLGVSLIARAIAPTR